MEQGRCHYQNALPVNSTDDVLDDLGYLDEEEQEGNQWQHEDVWQRPSSAQKQSAIDAQRAGLRSTTAVPGAQQRAGGSQQSVHQPHASSMANCQSSIAHLQTEAQQLNRVPDRGQQESQETMLPVYSAADVSMNVMPSRDSIPLVPAIVTCVAMPDGMPNVMQTSAGMVANAVPQRVSSEQVSVGSEAMQSSARQASTDSATAVKVVAHTEQSDRELALRLQKEENALQQQQVRLVPKSLSTLKPNAKKANTIQSFFKKA